MTAPKITTVHRTKAGTWFMTLDGGGLAERSEKHLASFLAERGQTLDIPADVEPGWLGVPTDLPTPEPLPDLVMHCYVAHTLRPWWSMVEPATIAGIITSLATLTVRTDPATGEPVATIERVTP